MQIQLNLIALHKSGSLVRVVHDDGAKTRFNKPLDDNFLA